MGSSNFKFQNSITFQNQNSRKNKTNNEPNQKQTKKIWFKRSIIIDFKKLKMEAEKQLGSWKVLLPSVTNIAIGINIIIDSFTKLFKKNTVC